ncbi:hypothetical protein V1524DRAFT_100849 [Lipomyces starkeyi]
MTSLAQLSGIFTSLIWLEDDSFMATNIMQMCHVRTLISIWAPLPLLHQVNCLLLGHLQLTAPVLDKLYSNYNQIERGWSLQMRHTCTLLFSDNGDTYLAQIAYNIYASSLSRLLTLYWKNTVITVYGSSNGLLVYFGLSLRSYRSRHYLCLLWTFGVCCLYIRFWTLFSCISIVFYRLLGH